MGISFSSTSMLSLLAAPVQALAAWFVPAQNAEVQYILPASAQQRTDQLALRFATGATAARCRSAIAVSADLPSSKATPKIISHSRLRVVREFDSAVSPSCAGRMVLSGRMSDVCAELERMAQFETAAH